MALYEYVILIDHSISFDEVNSMVDSISDIIQKNSGEVLSTEYWGVRTISYKINNHKKAHYLMLQAEITKSGLTEVSKYRKNIASDSIVRDFILSINDVSKVSSNLMISNKAESYTLDAVVTKEKVFKKFSQ